MMIGFEPPDLPPENLFTVFWKFLITSSKLGGSCLEPDPFPPDDGPSQLLHARQGTAPISASKHPHVLLPEPVVAAHQWLSPPSRHDVAEPEGGGDHAHDAALGQRGVLLRRGTGRLSGGSRAEGGGQRVLSERAD